MTTTGLTVSNLADDWLDAPIGTTTPATRTAARNCVHRNVDDDHAGDVLAMLGLSPTVYTCEPFTSDRGHQASTRNRVRKPR